VFESLESSSASPENFWVDDSPRDHVHFVEHAHTQFLDVCAEVADFLQCFDNNPCVADVQCPQAFELLDALGDGCGDDGAFKVEVLDVCQMAQVFETVVIEVFTAI
jgi:hypothetical protein